ASGGLLLGVPRQGGVAVLEERPPDLPAGDCLLGLSTDDRLPPWGPSDDSVAAAFEDAADDIEPGPDPPAGPIDPDDDRIFERLQRSYGSAAADFDAGVGGLVGEGGGWGAGATGVGTVSRG